MKTSESSTEDKHKDKMALCVVYNHFDSKQNKHVCYNTQNKQMVYFTCNKQFTKGTTYCIVLNDQTQCVKHSLAEIQIVVPQLNPEDVEGTDGYKDYSFIGIVVSMGAQPTSVSKLLKGKSKSFDKNVVNVELCLSDGSTTVVPLTVWGTDARAAAKTGTAIIAMGVQHLNYCNFVGFTCPVDGIIMFDARTEQAKELVRRYAEKPVEDVEFDELILPPGMKLLE